MEQESPLKSGEIVPFLGIKSLMQTQGNTGQLKISWKNTNVDVKSE